MNICQLDQLRNVVQSSHINFLFGSGLSCPFLSTLNSIERLLTNAQQIKNDNLRKIVEASLFAEYFSSVMSPCIAENIVGEKKTNYDNVLSNYSGFLSIWNAIISHRSTALLDKTINIFTTNIDNLVETSAERLKLVFNDGFQGHLNPIFREDSFNNVLTRISPIYQNLAQVPLFNYIKIHGSINWMESELDFGYLTYDRSLELLHKIQDHLKKVPDGHLVLEIDNKETIESLIKKAEAIIQSDDYVFPKEINEFMDAYQELVMIHPRKTKFKESVIDSHFYELMRRFSNSLEQANTVLFVSGFSFADEHIAKITMRAANTNPTLQIIVFAYKEEDVKEIEDNLNLAGASINHNIQIMSPQKYYNAQDEKMRDKLNVEGFKTIQEVKTKDENGKLKSTQQILFQSFSLDVLNSFVFNKLRAIVE